MRASVGGAVTIVVGVFVALTLAAAPLTGQSVKSQNDPRVAAVLEPIRTAHHLPALGGAIVTSRGLTAVAVTGVRKSGTDVAAAPDDLWHLGSDTKAMTAAWIAHVVGRTPLKWDAAIGAVLPRNGRRIRRVPQDHAPPAAVAPRGSSGQRRLAACLAQRRYAARAAARRGSHGGRRAAAIRTGLEV